MQVRGGQLKDTVEVASLKPCHLTIVEGEHPQILNSTRANVQKRGNRRPTQSLTRRRIAVVRRGLHGGARRRARAAAARHCCLHHRFRDEETRAEARDPRCRRARGRQGR